MAVSHVKSNTVANWTGTVTVGNSTGGTETIAATDLVRPIDWNSAHNQFYTLTGNTTNSSTASGSNVVFGATGNLTVYGTSDSVFFSAPPRDILSTYQNQMFYNSGTMSVGGGSSNYVFPFLMPQDGSFSYMRMIVSASLVTTTATTGAAGYGTSCGASQTLWANIYTQGTGANSRSLQWLTSASTTWANQYSWSGTSSSYSVTVNVTHPAEGGASATFSTSTTGAGGVLNVTPGAATNSFGSYRFFDMPFATSLSAGNYWMALQRSSTTVGSNAPLNVSTLMVTQSLQNSVTNFFGTSGTISSNQFSPYLGLWSTNSNGATTSSIARSLVSTLASHPIPVFQFIREA